MKSMICQSYLSNLLPQQGLIFLHPSKKDILQTGVFDKGISDHAAITAVTHIKRLPKDNFVKTREVHRTWFDVGSAVRELQDGKESINDLSFDQLVKSTMGKIKNHLYILPKKKKTSKTEVLQMPSAIEVNLSKKNSL